MSSRSWWLLLVACGVVGATGCRIAPLEQGYTECGEFMSDGPELCQPGQYCVDPTFSECRPGCTSDENCARNQVCVKERYEQVGICHNRCTTCADDGADPEPVPGTDPNAWN
jgi:hypothetical protein